MSVCDVDRAAVGGKELYLPQEIDRGPKGNDFTDVQSEFCFKHMVQGDSMALFWSKEYGDDPMANPDEKKRFDPQFAMQECERFYDYYVDELKMVLKGPGGAIMEMSAQYLLWQVYPEWMMFDACRRVITWDMDRIREVAQPYANQHRCALHDVGDGWYRIAASNCPQDYGYNGIKLKVPAAGTTVVLNFKGIAGAEGFSQTKTDKAGWRYGFLASLKDGSRVHGNVGANPQEAAAFEVPENTECLWLVVMGAPKEH